MANLKKICCFFPLILVLITLLVGLGEATTASLTVKQGDELIHPIDLITDDRVFIQFKVIGVTSNRIQFSITFPNGTVQNLAEIGDFSASFVCDVEGQCTLNFTNTDQVEHKLVTLNYNITHYIFGMPQMLFMVILIAVVSLAGVAVFIGLSRKPY
ncbi:hypothetical protein E2P60_02345 [Candidatus Bathyarchaeota archaeon]|nr:hypothetical protein E2P60_02345 [Candidatus Bathyarchaeota archaeon]